MRESDLARADGKQPSVLAGSLAALSEFTKLLNRDTHEVKWQMVAMVVMSSLQLVSFPVLEGTILSNGLGTASLSLSSVLGALSGYRFATNVSLLTFTLFVVISCLWMVTFLGIVYITCKLQNSRSAQNAFIAQITAI